MVGTIFIFVFFFNDTATTEIYTLSLHDALPILAALAAAGAGQDELQALPFDQPGQAAQVGEGVERIGVGRSEEHTSELQSRQYLVCRLLLEKKKHNKLTSLFVCDTYTSRSSEH